ncbi:HAD family hydrolase [Halovulum dunhuangense]|uniref:HAD family hydrolase n=2 Tax=Halovulum dunhuangense TaxID=1505036 RepID=A0A849L0Q8_9RHOB|nr:HAD family hydrolase [Halovulum dunhuangense]NNU79843.1 HAD family hydrolase [Halovulum dunhuangense]
MLEAIGFDADDTLWQNEQFFRITEGRFHELLNDYAAPDHLAERLLAAERRNLARYGFGVKGFTLSMIETAIEVTEARVPAHILRDILEAGKELHAHPIELLPNVRQVVERLADTHRLLLITKGDLFDQERKLAQSGLGDLFDGVEIVSDKTPGTYARIFRDHAGGAEAGLMAGNSLKSDVIPMIQAGGWGVHVPHGLTWALEHAEAPREAARFRKIDDLGGLLPLVEEINAAGSGSLGSR